MESLPVISSQLRADAPVFTPNPPSAANGAPLRRRASAAGGRSFTAASGRGGRGGGGARGGGRSHPLPRGSTFAGNGNRRSSMSSVSDAQRGSTLAPDPQVLKERAFENASPGGGAANNHVDPSKPFHSKMSSTEAYKLRQAKASAAFVKKQRAKASQAATAVSTTAAGAPTSQGNECLQPADTAARSADASVHDSGSGSSSKAFVGKGKDNSQGGPGSSLPGDDGQRIEQSTRKLTEGSSSEQLRATGVSPNFESVAPVSPISNLATRSGGGDVLRPKPFQTNSLDPSLQHLEPNTAATVERCDLSPSAMSILSGAGSLSESPEQNRAKGMDRTRRRLEPTTSAVNSLGATNTVPCDLDESGKCVHAVAAAAANAAATAAANAAAAAAAAASSTPGISSTGSSAVDLESGKWCEDCAGLGLHIAALVAELKAGKVVDRRSTEGERGSGGGDEEEKRDRPKTSWKRTVSNAMLGSTTGSGSGVSASDVAKLRADKAQLADENQILRATVEYLFKKVGDGDK